MPKLFGEVVRTIREDADLSIRDIARATGIAVGQLSQLETGVKRDPTFSTVRKIAKALRVSIDDLARACEGEPSGAIKPSPEAFEAMHLLRELQAASGDAERVVARLQALTHGKKFKTKKA